MKILVLEHQLNNILNNEEKLLFIEKFDSLTVGNQKLVLEILNIKDSEVLLTEAWWNTIGDVVGILDPTGVVDFVNGLDYIRQGDFFFGFLSLVAAVPYVGDAVAKPIMMTGKVNKGLNSALKIAKNATKVDDIKLAGKVLDKASQSNFLVRNLVDTAPRWGETIKKTINSIPGNKLVPGLKKTVIDWVDLFANAAKRKGQLRRLTANLATNVTTNPTTAAQLVQQIKRLQNVKTGAFSSFKIKDPGFMTKYFWPGFSIRTKKNRELIGMMRRTKFYAGLLDFMGLGNFVGPDELIKKVGEETFDSTIKQYVNTPEGKKYYEEDFSSILDDETDTQKSKDKNKSILKDPLDLFFDELLN